jgi:glutamyl-Q tRNA(Asp) synthetase
MILAVSRLKNFSSQPVSYRGRFAPSPTGPLHAGSLVTALGSWLDARKNNGKWLLRIEDLDSPRCVPGADLQIQAQLLACGLRWDEETTWQSKRQDGYQKALEKLNTLQLLYPCSCSRLSIAQTLTNRGILITRHQEIVYPGTCRPVELKTNSPSELKNTQLAWRLALPCNCETTFMDAAQGVQKQNLTQEVGDFVLRRNDGIFTYQLAVVVDDALQGITHVVRGADLLGNTARQIHLQNVLGFKTPYYRHLPIVLDEHGEKLSKQTLATRIQTQTEKEALAELRKAASHLRLKELPDGDNITINEWLLAATQAWPSD